MAKTVSTEELPPEYQRLRRRLGQVGWIALGRLVERTKSGQGGPRYQWSRRVGRKTVTVALSAEQYEWLKQVIANQRAVWADLMRMQQITAEYMLQNLPNPPRRKRLTKKALTNRHSDVFPTIAATDGGGGSAREAGRGQKGAPTEEWRGFRGRGGVWLPSGRFLRGRTR